MKRVLVRMAVLVAIILVIRAILRQRSEEHEARARMRRAHGRRGRYLAGRREGLKYRLQGRRPAPEVSDDVLADRIRSEIGPLEKRLDVPHLNVTVEGHVALLHGVVDKEADADALEFAVANVSGIRGVESYLHIGVPAGDTRPSEGGTDSTSDALERLLAAAAATGAPGSPRSVVRAVLATFAEHVPDDERRHLFSHLPEDVRALATPPRRRGARVARIHHVDEFVAAVTAADGLDPSGAVKTVESVLGALRELVPEETADIAAVLPVELRKFWNAAIPQ